MTAVSGLKVAHNDPILTTRSQLCQAAWPDEQLALYLTCQKLSRGCVRSICILVGSSEDLGGQAGWGTGGDEAFSETGRVLRGAHETN